MPQSICVGTYAAYPETLAHMQTQPIGGTHATTVQAENDPIAPYEAVPQQAIADNPNCVLASTPTGGHLAWISGPTGPFGALLACSKAICW